MSREPSRDVIALAEQASALVARHKRSLKQNCKLVRQNAALSETNATLTAESAARSAALAAAVEQSRAEASARLAALELSVRAEEERVAAQRDLTRLRATQRSMASAEAVAQAIARESSLEAERARSAVVAVAQARDGELRKACELRGEVERVEQALRGATAELVSEQRTVSGLRAELRDADAAARMLLEQLAAFGTPPAFVGQQKKSAAEITAGATPSSPGRVPASARPSPSRAPPPPPSLARGLSSTGHPAGHEHAQRMRELERHMASTALLDNGGGGGGGGGATDAVGNGNMRRAARAAHELQTSDEVEELCAALALAVREVEETHDALAKLELLRTRETSTFNDDLEAAAARYAELERSSSLALKAERRRCARLEAQLRTEKVHRGDAAALVQRVRAAAKVKAARSGSSPPRRSPSLTRSLDHALDETAHSSQSRVKTKKKKKKKTAAESVMTTSPQKKKTQKARAHR